MATPRRSQLQKLAVQHGIQPSFIDDRGREQFASDETLRILIESFGVEKRGTVDPVHVCWQGRQSSLPIKGAKSGRVALTIRDEAGAEVGQWTHRIGSDNVTLPLPKLETG